MHYCRSKINKIRKCISNIARSLMAYMSLKYKWSPLIKLPLANDNQCKNSFHSRQTILFLCVYMCAYMCFINVTWIIKTLLHDCFFLWRRDSIWHHFFFVKCHCFPSRYILMIVDNKTLFLFQSLVTFRWKCQKVT